MDNIAWSPAEAIHPADVCDLLSVLLHLPLHIMWSSFEYTHPGVTVGEFKNNENGITAPSCLCFSDVSHLYAAGLDLKYNNGVEL